MKNKIIKSCCFTGHRDISEEKIPEIKKGLFTEIDKLYKEGFTNFITGGAKGFDTVAAQVVLEYKKNHSNVTLTIISPFVGFEKEKTNADQYIELAKKYSKGCFAKRNREMVDRSQKCIAYLAYSPSGTSQTVNYANISNVEVINVFKE